MQKLAENVCADTSESWNVWIWARRTWPCSKICRTIIIIIFIRTEIIAATNRPGRMGWTWWCRPRIYVQINENEIKLLHSQWNHNQRLSIHLAQITFHFGSENSHWRPIAKANAFTYIYLNLCMALDSGCDQIVSLAHSRWYCCQCMYRDHLDKCVSLVWNWEQKSLKIVENGV